MTLATDQLLFLAVAAIATPQERCDYAEKFNSSSSMKDLIAKRLVDYVAPKPGNGRAFIIITEKGRVLIDAMCALPLPVNGWRVP